MDRLSSSLATSSPRPIEATLSRDSKQQPIIKVVPPTQHTIHFFQERDSFTDSSDSCSSLSDNDSVEEEEQTPEEKEVASLIREGEELLAQSTSPQKQAPRSFSFKSIRQATRSALGIQKKPKQPPSFFETLAVKKRNSPLSLTDTSSTEEESSSSEQGDVTPTSKTPTAPETEVSSFSEKEEILLHLSKAEEAVQQAVKNLEAAERRLKVASELIEENNRNPDVKKAKMKAPLFLQEQKAATIDYEAKLAFLEKTKIFFKSAQVMLAKNKLEEAKTAYEKAEKIVAAAVQPADRNKALTVALKAYGFFRVAQKKYDALVNS